LVATAEPYIGKYYSQDYVRRSILKQTDQEIIEQDILIKKEIDAGIIPDPNAPIDPATGMPMDTTVGAGNPNGGDNINGEAGKVPVDPEPPK
jgi:hypothetical protein